MNNSLLTFFTFYDLVSIPLHNFNNLSIYDTTIHMTYEKICKLYGKPIINFLSHRFNTFSDEITKAKHQNDSYYQSFCNHLSKVYIQWRITNENNEIIAVIYNELQNYYSRLIINNNIIIFPSFNLFEALELDTHHFCIDAINDNVYQDILKKLNTTFYNRIKISEKEYIDEDKIEDNDS